MKSDKYVRDCLILTDDEDENSDKKESYFS